HRRLLSDVDCAELVDQLIGLDTLLQLRGVAVLDERSAADALGADELVFVGRGDEDVVDARGEVIAVRGNLDLDDLTLDVEGEEVESVHPVDDCADEARREVPESVATGAAGHPDAHPEGAEAGVPGLLSSVPESPRRQG